MADDLDRLLAQVPRTMMLIYLFAAAVQDASPEQREQLAAAKDLLREPVGTPGASMRDIAERVVTIMGDEWMPSGQWLQAIEAING